jgi:transcriptional regulator GlxA family with amidase domain
MDAASHEDWPVRRLAAVSCVSEAHFARSFKAAFGLPPHRYLLTRRIERAKAPLRDTDLRIIEIALSTGWESLGRCSQARVTASRKLRPDACIAGRFKLAGIFSRKSRQL